MSDIIKIISTNIPWVKDLFTIILTLTATIIAYLTYKRARATVLQPIRTEVIKKQVEILTEILSFISKHSYSAKQLYDYGDLISINREIVLDNLGLHELTKTDIENINQKIKGWVLFLKNDKSKFVYVVGNYDDYKDSLKTAELESGIEYVEEFVKDKEAGLNVIFFTNQYFESYSQISKYSDNPLLPVSVIKQLMFMKYDGKFNLILNLEEIIVSFIKKYYELIKQNNINYDTVSSLNRESYENFEAKRFKHEDTILKLKGCIRKHLRIDEKW